MLLLGGQRLGIAALTCANQAIPVQFVFIMADAHYQTS